MILGSLLVLACPKENINGMNKRINIEKNLFIQWSYVSKNSEFPFKHLNANPGPEIFLDFMPLEKVFRLCIVTSLAPSMIRTP